MFLIVFSYICDGYAIKEQRKPVADFVKSIICIFQKKIADKINACVPHVLCKTCSGIFQMWAHKKKHI